MLSICQSFLVLYTFLNPAYIAFIVLLYKIAEFYYYSMPIIDLLIFNILMPYLRVMCIILDFNKSCLKIALKM